MADGAPNVPPSVELNDSGVGSIADCRSRAGLLRFNCPQSRLDFYLDMQAYALCHQKANTSGC